MEKFAVWPNGDWIQIPPEDDPELFEGTRLYLAERLDNYKIFEFPCYPGFDVNLAVKHLIRCGEVKG